MINLSTNVPTSSNSKAIPNKFLINPAAKSSKDPEGDKSKETKVGIPIKRATTKKLSTQFGEKKDDKKKDESETKVEQSWPPFQFDGSQALKSKLVLNLRACQYDLFRTIALDELGWKIVNYNNEVWEPKE
jgi:hypothetical protein